MEVQALRFNELYTSYDNYLNSIYENIATYNYGFLLNSDIENIRSNYDSTIKYVTTLIYNYYYDYYLTSASEVTFKRLHTMTMVAKLPYFKSLIDKYNNLINANLDKTNGQENNATSNGEITRSGNSRQATTPQDLSNADYIDDYSSSQQKYSSNNTDTRTNTFTSNNTGSISDTFKHIEDIPKRIFNEVISLFGKYFFAYDNDTPYAYLSLENAFKELETELVTEIDKINTTITPMVSAITNLNNNYITLNSNVNKISHDLESTIKDVPTALISENNKVYLVHDNIKLSPQTPLSFKKINGVSVLGNGSISTATDSDIDTLKNLIDEVNNKIPHVHNLGSTIILDELTNLEVTLNYSLKNTDILKMKFASNDNGANDFALLNSEPPTIYLKLEQIGYDTNTESDVYIYKSSTIYDSSITRVLYLYVQLIDEAHIKVYDWYIQEFEGNEV